MPYEFDDLSKQVSQGAEDVKKGLDGIVDAAKNADDAYAKLTETQKTALQISEKFEKALGASAKSLTLFGHSGMSASRGLKTIDTVSKNAASSLSLVGTGAASALASLRALSTESIGFSTNISNGEKSLAGLVQQLKEMPSTALPTVGASVTASAAAATAKTVIKKTQSATASALSNPNMSGAASLLLGTTQSAGKNIKSRIGKYGKFAVGALDKVIKDMKAKTSKERDALELLEEDTGTAGKKKQYIELAVKIAGESKLREFLDDMEEVDAKLFKKNIKKMGMEAAINDLIAKTPILGLHLKKAAAEAKEAAEEITSEFKKLEAQANMESKSIGDVYKKMFASGAVEAGEFGGGLGKNATGMLAVGVAGAFLAKKIGEVAENFASAAIGLAKYRTETSALERTLIGMNKGGLEAMRKELYLTKEQAAVFFDVVKKGVNELGMSQAEIMRVSKALKETFGGDQTERLKNYVDLLESIPTLDTDLKITASPDDQAKALFGLMETGKVNVALDLQEAGLLGGSQKKQPGADMANTAQRAAAATEGIQDFLLNTFYPEWGAWAKEGMGIASKVVSASFAVVAGIGAFNLLLNKNHSEDTAQRAELTARLETAILSGKAQVPGGAGVAGGATNGLSKLTKGLGIAAVATFGLELGFNALESHMEKAGNETGAAGAKMGKAAASVAAMALTGAALGSVIPVIGTAVGAAAGALLGLYNEAGNISEAWKKLHPEIEESGKALSYFDTVVGVAAESNRNSQKTAALLWKKTGDLMGSAKYKLAEFNSAVAEATLRMSQRIGTEGQFGGAVDAKFLADQSKYQDKMSDLARQRAELDSMTNLTASQRQTQSKRLDSEKIKADEEFINATLELAQALFKSPDIIRAGIQEAWSTRKLGIGAQGETLGKFEKATIETNQSRALETQSSKTVDQGLEAIKLSKKVIADIDAATAKDHEAALQRIADIDKQFDQNKETASIRSGKIAAAQSKKAMNDYWGQVVEAQSKKQKYLKDNEESKKQGKGPMWDESAWSEQDKIIQHGIELQNEANRDQAALNDALKKRDNLLEVQKNLKAIPKTGEVNKEVIGKMLDKSMGAAKDIQGQIVQKTKDLEKAPKQSKESANLFSDITGLQDKLGQNEKEQQILKRLQEGGAADTILMQQVMNSLKQNDDIQDNILQAEKTRVETFDKDYQQQVRIVETAQMSADVASKTGNAIAENAKLAEEKNKLSRMEYEHYSQGIRVTEKNMKGMEERITELNKTRDEIAKKEGEGYETSFLDDVMEKLRGTIGQMKKVASDAETKAGEAAQKWHVTGELLLSSISEIDSTAAGIRLKNLRDLSGAMLDGAQYMGNFAKASSDSFEMAKKAAADQKKLEEDNIKAMMSLERENINNKVNLASRAAMEEAKAKGATPGEAEKAGRLAGKKTRVEEEEKLADVAHLASVNAITRQFKSIEDAAEKIKRAEEDRIDIQKGLIDDAMSFASDFGGSFSSIMKLQQLNVGLAQQQLDSATAFRDRVQQAFEAGEGWAQDGTAMMRANADVAAKTLGLRRQEMGVQKSMMDRLLGGVFGELKGGGARKNFGSDQALMGVGATRAKSASGVYMDVPGGKPGTIAERSMQRTMAGAGGVFSAGGGVGGGGSQDFVGMVEAALKTTPSRSPLEGALGQASAATADNTKKTADATVAIAKAVTNGAFVSSVKDATDSSSKTDQNVQKSLQINKKELKNSTQDLQLTKKDVQISKSTLGGGLGGGNFGATSTTLGGGRFDANSRTLGGGKFSSGSRTLGGGKFDANSRTLGGGLGGTAVLPPKSIRAAATSEGSAGESAKVQGEIMVKFDNKMFRDQLAPIMGSLMKTPDMVKSVQSSAWGSGAIA